MSQTDRELLDHVALQSVMARYFQAVDRNDQKRIRSCFTEDVKATYHTRATMVGVEATLASLRPHFDNLEKGVIKTATHFMGSFCVDRLESDSAETETYALAFIVRAATGDAPEHLAMRSLRYLDRWRRGKGAQEHAGWQICERIHTLDWSTKTTPDYATVIAKRVMRLP
jgi:hypothetical protein